jgi:hypothetical protein
MRLELTLCAAVLTALIPSAVQAQGAGARVVGGTGIDAFGGIFVIAPNPALIMEGPGRDIGRDLASHWVTYRWAAPNRPKAQCEINLDRFDHLGFTAEQPDQATLDAKEADRIRAIVAAPKPPWVGSTVEFVPWGRLTLIELASNRNDGAQTLNVDALYVAGRYVYTIRYFCTGAPLADLRELRNAIRTRNITQN